MAIPRLCSISNCGKPSQRRDLCWSHYFRWHRYGDPTAGGTLHGSPMKWIDDHVDHRGLDCLPWPFGRFSTGYGMIGMPNGSRMQASRYMCARAHGNPPTEFHDAAHSCNNGHDGCTNPNHLRWATVSENMMDKVANGTATRGERAPCSKLTEAQVLEIRSIAGATHTEIAMRYGVSQRAISHIRSRTTWGWLS